VGEYIGYRGHQVKIGTCDDMYYVSYQKYEMALKRGLLGKVPGSSDPMEYAKPDSGCRFRFPFPDEDKLPFGDIGNFSYDRAVKVKVDQEIDPLLSKHFASIPGKDFEIEILRQKPLHREADGKLILALVIRDPLSSESYRIEDIGFIRKLTKEIVRNHVTGEADLEKKNFHQALCERMLEGYNLKMFVNKQLVMKPPISKNAGKRRQNRKGL
jgi:hypothetical protein